MIYIYSYLLLTLICFLLAPSTSFAYKYSRRIWIGIDQLFNAALFGNEDHTISGRAGRGRREGSTFWRITANVIDWIFRDNQHCRNAIEYNEHKLDYGHSKTMIAICSGLGAFSVYVVALMLEAAI